MFKKIKFTLFLVLILFANMVLFAQTKTEVWFVADKKVDCVGMVPQKCLVVREVKTGNWQVFYGEIKGFKFKENYTQKIRVRISNLKNVPADALAFDYKMIKVLSKSKTAGNTIEEALNSMKKEDSDQSIYRKWKLIELNGKTISFKSSPPFIELNAKNGNINGWTGCNNLMGKFEISGNLLKIIRPATTLMACVEEANGKTEYEFTNTLEKINRFEIKEQNLFLYKDSQLLIKLLAY